jgi:hypothetical protein
MALGPVFFRGGAATVEGTMEPREWDPEHLAVARNGTLAIAEWREKSPRERLKLAGADIRKAPLRGANLANADLRGARLERTTLAGAILNDADLEGAALFDADLADAGLHGSNLWGAYLDGANMVGTSLRGANLTSSSLKRAQLIEVSVVDANLVHAMFDRTPIASDLTGARFLEQAIHVGPSFITHNTLLRRTQRPWPLSFLRGCGLTDFEIEHTRSIATNPIEFYSCFISYSSKDDAFAVNLHDALQAKGIRCWLDKHEALPGDNVTKKVGEGIRLWDKVLLCCSRNSMTPSTGWWVTDEIERALQKERQLQKERNEETLAVIPLNLDGFLFDTACTHEHQPTLAKRHAANFVGWQTDEKVFDAQVERVVKALRADDLARPKPPAPKL